MKYLKSTMAFLLSVGFVFSAFGCGEKKNDNKDSGNKDNNSSTVGTTIPEDREGVWEVVNAAKSAKISIDFSQKVVDGESEQGLGVALDIILSQTETGVDAKLQLETKNESGEETATQTSEFYLIDGWAYAYDAEENVCLVQPSTLETEILNNLEDEGVNLEEVEAAVGELMATLEEMIGDTQINIGEVVNGIFEVGAKLEDGAMMITLDYAPYVNGVLDYLAALEGTTKVETVIDDLLALVNPEWTCEKIFTEVATWGAVTVEEAYDEIDGIVTEVAGAGLQDTKDMLMAMPEVQGVLVEAGVSAEDIQMIIDMDIEAMLAEYFEMTLNEVVRGIIMANQEDTTAPDSSYGGEEYEDTASDEYVDTTSDAEMELPEDIIGEYVMMAYGYLSEMTLADVATMVETENLVEILNMVGTIELEEGSIKYGVKYDKDWNVDSIIAKEAFKMNAPEGEEGYVSMYLDFVISELSETAVAITLPEGATMIYECYECYVDSTEDETVKLSETYGVYLCETCEEVYGYERCEYCYEKKADAKYYEEMDWTLCDECYESMSTPSTECEFCWEQKDDVAYRSDVEFTLCDACYAEALAEATDTACDICGDEAAEYYSEYYGYYCEFCYTAVSESQE